MEKSYKWEEILRNCVTKNSIKAVYLEHIPKLKDCENWGQAIFLGRVRHQFKLTSIDGGLVRFKGKLYYINAKQIVALAKTHKWNTSNIINVTE
ncbi:MAG: hypothetical protein MJB14_03685 [Spirochaetes bacterium]|nr:hypothetical protein [Spirochaetota bacterium]